MLQYLLIILDLDRFPMVVPRSTVFEHWPTSHDLNSILPGLDGILQ